MVMIQKNAKIVDLRFELLVFTLCKNNMAIVIFFQVMMVEENGVSHVSTLFFFFVGNFALLGYDCFLSFLFIEISFFIVRSEMPPTT